MNNHDHPADQARPKAGQSPLYIYAFCGSRFDADHIEGVGDQGVRFIERAGIFAAVSDAPPGRIRPRRHLLRTHQHVLASLAASIPTLPAAFGLVAASPDLLAAAIEENADDLHAELERVGRCVEMDVRLGRDAARVFDHLVSVDETRRAMRSEMVSLGDEAPHDLRVEVGRRVEYVLTHHRESARDAIIRGLEPVCREIELAEPSSESDLVCLAALIGRDERSAFDAAIESLAEAFDESHVIRIAGPFAPHSFLDLHVDLSNSRVADATERAA
ncbi:MAG: GvpL/GvpF family gas vesicle protein [Planctomycetota bacterium]